LEEARKLPDPTRVRRDRTKIAELSAEVRCSQKILDFLATTDVGSHRWQEQRPARPRREREERLAALREEEERLGVGE